MRSTAIGNAAVRYEASPEIGEHNDNVSRNAFSHGNVWPIPEIALATLVDMGLSDARIAHYFRIDPAAVRSLRMDYCIMAHR